MEVASASDLKTASKQGTILAIHYGNTWYGEGSVVRQQTSNHYRSTQGSSNQSYGRTVATGCGMAFLLAGVLLVARKFLGGKRAIVAVGTEPVSALKQSLSPSGGVVV